MEVHYNGDSTEVVFDKEDDAEIRELFYGATKVILAVARTWNLYKRINKA